MPRDKDEEERPAWVCKAHDWLAFARSEKAKVKVRRRLVLEVVPGHNFRECHPRDSSCIYCVSYELDLRGPSFTIKSACSSSLLALHEAARVIQAGDCDSTIVAGINLISSPDYFVETAAGGNLSPTSSWLGPSPGEHSHSRLSRSRFQRSVNCTTVHERYQTRTRGQFARFLHLASLPTPRIHSL